MPILTKLSRAAAIAAIASSGCDQFLCAWDATTSNWYFYAPHLDQPGAPFTNAQYGAANGYQDFAGGTLPAPALSLQPGVGFWVEKY